MMRACLLLLLAAALAPARAVPALRASSSSHLHAAPRVAQSTCDTCLDVARDFEQYLVDPKTQDAVVSFVQDNICSLLPPDAGATCAQEARVAVAQAVASITQTLTPQMVCDYLGVCQAAGPGAAADARLAGGPVECPLCKLVFAQLVARLQDPTSRADIQRSAQEACQDLEGAAAVTKCLGDVAQLFAAVDALLDDVDAHRACQVAQFCGAADGAAAAERAPSPGVAALRALGSRLAALSSDSCDECKSVIAQAAATLEDPETQRQAMDYAKTMCAAFDDYRPQCEAAVEDYGQVAFDMAIAYLQPDQVCTRLGYCKASRAAL